MVEEEVVLVEVSANSGNSSNTHNNTISGDLNKYTLKILIRDYSSSRYSKWRTILAPEPKHFNRKLGLSIAETSIKTHNNLLEIV